MKHIDQKERAITVSTLKTQTNKRGYRPVPIPDDLLRLLKAAYKLDKGTDRFYGVIVEVRRFPE